MARSLKTPKLATADVCDARGDDVDFVPLAFRNFGGRFDFAGSVVTVKTLDDNSLVKKTLEEPGEGRVLVVDGGGSLRSALVGGNLATLAENNGWAGIIVNGCVRDSHELIAINIGIKALNVCPRKSVKAGRGVKDIQISMGDVLIKPGNWVIADADGVVVSKELPSL